MVKNTLLILAISTLLGTSMFAQGRAKDRTEDLPEIKTAVVIFYADWCSPCSQMKKNVWPNKKVQDIIKKNDYELHWINTDTNPELKKAYKVNGIPAIFIITYDKKNHNGGIVQRENVGYMDVNELCGFLTLPEKQTIPDKEQQHGNIRRNW